MLFRLKKHDRLAQRTSKIHRQCLQTDSHSALIYSNRRPVLFVWGLDFDHNDIHENIRKHHQKLTYHHRNRLRDYACYVWHQQL